MGVDPARAESLFLAASDLPDPAERADYLDRESGGDAELRGRVDAAAAENGKAAAELLPLVYDELRKLAAARIAAEPAGHTLNATALVHEAYLRLIGDQRFDGRGHFFAAAAEAMRRESYSGKA
jgi:hypothetical protein